MKSFFSRVLTRWGVLCVLGASLALLGGCAGDGGAAAPSRTAVAPGDGVAGSPLISNTEIFKAEDILNITFSDLPTTVPQFQDKIGKDGTITLQYSETFQAAGKTRQQLQQEIKERYVPKYYKYLTVTITPMLQFYFVGGEVRQPGRYEHVGGLTVRKALQSAGDFTDFANKKNVKLTRAGSNKQFTINAVKALRNPELDMEVLPGDTIHVPRRRI